MASVWWWCCTAASVFAAAAGWAGDVTSSATVGHESFYTVKGDTRVYSAADARVAFDAAAIGGLCAVRAARTAPNGAKIGFPAAASGLAGDGWCGRPGTVYEVMLALERAAWLEELRFEGVCLEPGAPGHPCQRWAHARNVTAEYWDGAGWVPAGEFAMEAPLPRLVVRVDLPTPVRRMRFTVAGYHVSPCLRVDVAAYCHHEQHPLVTADDDDGGGGAAPYVKSHLPVRPEVTLATVAPAKLGVIVSTATSHFLYSVDAVAAARGDITAAPAVYACTGGDHTPCADGAGYPVVSWEARAGVAFLRPSGSGRLYLVHHEQLVLVRDGGEWRGLGWLGARTADAGPGGVFHEDDGTRVHLDAAVAVVRQTTTDPTAMTAGGGGAARGDAYFLRWAAENSTYYTGTRRGIDDGAVHHRPGVCALGSDFSAAYGGGGAGQPDCSAALAPQSALSGWDLPTGTRGAAWVDPTGAVADPHTEVVAVLDGTWAVFKSFDDAHGMELWGARLPDLRRYGAAPRPPPCRALDFADGATPPVRARLPRPLDVDGFTLELEVWLAADFDLTAQPGNLTTFVSLPGEWAVGYDHTGVGVTVFPAKGCYEAVPIPPVVHVPPFPSKLTLAVDPRVAHCVFEEDVDPALGFTAEIRTPGVLEVERANSEGWEHNYTLQCRATACAGGAGAALPLQEWTRLRYACDGGRCTFQMNDAAPVESPAIASYAPRNALPSYVYIGADAQYPDPLAATSQFNGRIRGLRMDGRCLVPDTPATTSRSCPAPAVSAVNGTGAAWSVADKLWAQDGVVHEMSSVTGWWVEYAFEVPAAGDAPRVESVSYACDGIADGCPAQVAVEYWDEGEGAWHAVQSHRGANMTVGEFGTPQGFEVESPIRAVRWRIGGAPDVAQDPGTAEVAWDPAFVVIALDYLDVGFSCEHTAPSEVHLVADINPGPGSSNPIGGVTVRGMVLFFAASDPLVSAYTLWGYTRQHGVVQVSAAHTVLVGAGAAPEYPLGVAFDHLGLAAWLVRGGLLVSDGTAAGTVFHAAPAPTLARPRAAAPPRNPPFAAGRGAGRSAGVFDVVQEGKGVGVAAYYCVDAAAFPDAASLLCEVQVRSPAEVGVRRSIEGAGTLHPLKGDSHLVSSAGGAGDRVTYVHFNPRASAAMDKSWAELAGGGCAAGAVLHANAGSEAVSVAGGGFVVFRGVNMRTWQRAEASLWVLGATWGRHPPAGAAGECTHLRLAVHTNATTTTEAADPATHLADVNVTLPAVFPAAVDVDVTPMLTQAAAAYNGSALPIDAVLGIQILGLGGCAPRVSAVPYHMHLATEAAPAAAYRPALCAARPPDGAQATASSAPLNEDAHLAFVPPSVTTAQYFYAGCGGVEVRFRVNQATLDFLQTGMLDGVSSQWHAITGVQVLRGRVDSVPDGVHLGPSGVVVGSTLSPYILYASDGAAADAQCNGANVTEEDVMYFGYLEPDAPPQVRVAARCDSEACTKKGGRCSGFTCECPANKVDTGETCSCAAGYYGMNCDVFCAAEATCSGRGHCTEDGNCQCRLGWGGAACDRGLSCADVQKLYPAARVHCEHVEKEVDVVADAGVIDTCTACREEGYRTDVHGDPVYYCKQ